MVSSIKEAVCVSSSKRILSSESVASSHSNKLLDPGNFVENSLKKTSPTVSASEKEAVFLCQKCLKTRNLKNETQTYMSLSLPWCLGMSRPRRFHDKIAQVLKELPKSS